MRITYHKPLRFLGNCRDNLIVDIALHEPAGARDARLSGSPEVTRNKPVGRSIHIGVIKHGDRRLAANFQGCHRKILGRVAHHVARSLRPAGKGDAVHVIVPCQRDRTVFRITGNDRHNTCRKPDSVY